ncbi:MULTISPECIES: DUF924 family protein [Bradyrhizobium]|uniref:DUF924 domain-containing protein n=1 Tax=Bradyrhizobium ottawaense TaxID=931866 RepID=A0A2U8P2Z6_9BRAD|nr:MULTISPECIES: DUF924 family protein [Bradyrhizobium]AWL92056.1 DUF924 domain-containing protein [Bradyrhizobium ottawaense]MBR1293185.1 DUF924 domain-containing protein [Bradyrhizobium ottawaense]MBR1325791.1 DUF924 domain-containing protein [Bradyrhizobium ottawaense]MBR1331661.1 DUF924 domain-containing protein [Bradyrhizobium ottawaense]MDA9416381.1 hypothetical protein [Bradyrhizobium sp. CCBAU 25360]
MTAVGDITPSGILAFWREAGRERWYERSDAFDAEVRRRFLALWQKAVAGEIASWEASDDGALALVIVLDQFPRNMFRGTPQAFASDALARDVARRAIDRGVDARVDPVLLEFLYLPFMHSEHLPDQLHCVALFQNTENAENLKYAREHADIIQRFGRFPHRNHLLGRDSTEEEQAFLDKGGFAG